MGLGGLATSGTTIRLQVDVMDGSNGSVAAERARHHQLEGSGVGGSRNPPNCAYMPVCAASSAVGVPLVDNGHTASASGPALDRDGHVATGKVTVTVPLQWQ